MKNKPLILVIVLQFAIIGILFFQMGNISNELNSMNNQLFNISGECQRQYSNLSANLSNSMEEKLDAYLKEEHSVVASSSLSFDSIDAKAGTAVVKVTCIPRYGVEEGKSRFFAVSDEGTTYESADLKWDGTTLTGTVKLDATRSYSYFVTLPGENGTATQCLADYEDVYNYDPVCFPQDNVTLHLSGFFDGSTIDKRSFIGNFTVGLDEQNDKGLNVTAELYRDGQLVSPISLVGYLGSRNGRVTISETDIPAGTKGVTLFTVRISAESPDGRTGVCYLDEGIQYSETGFETVCVNTETGELD